MSASGTFNINLEPQSDDDVPAGRMTIFKEYSGDMVGKGIGQMLSKRTESGTAVYSAIEEFEGKIKGKKGKFTLFHIGRMSNSEQSLDIKIVDGSGTGELTGIQGNLTIIQEGGAHSYTLDYSL